MRLDELKDVLPAGVSTEVDEEALFLGAQITTLDANGLLVVELSEAVYLPEVINITKYITLEIPTDDPMLSYTWHLNSMTETEI